MITKKELEAVELVLHDIEIFSINYYGLHSNIGLWVGQFSLAIG